MVKKLFNYKKEEVDSRIEEYKLKQCRMFTNRGFMVTVLDDDGNIIFSPYMVSNFSIDGNKIFITVYDLIQHINIEQKLDELCKGFWIFKKKLSVVLMRLDNENKEVYSVIYEKCKLRKYHGKNFTYKGNEPHQWYLELLFGSKEILKNEKFNFIPIENSIENIPTQEEINKKEIEILKYSNKMLDDSAEKIKSNTKLTDKIKENRINEINKAKSENETEIIKLYENSLKNFNLTEIEKSIKTQMEEIENNINKNR